MPRLMLGSAFACMAMIGILSLMCIGANNALAQSDDCSGIEGGGVPTIEAFIEYFRQTCILKYPPSPRPPSQGRYKYRDYCGLLIEENLVREIYPLLTSIFFDVGSSVLPQRYNLLTDTAELSRFDDARIPGGTLEKYRHVLNIIGYRLKSYPHTRISIGGYDSRQPALGETSQVAEARARVVRDYLIETWKIDPRRIRMAPSGGYPRIRSNPKDSISNAENRRVEIMSDDWEIMKPIIQQDFRRTSDPGEVIFRLRNGVPWNLIDHREIEIVRNGRSWHTIKVFSITDSIEPPYNWGKEGNPDSIPTDEAPYVVQLVIYLNDGRVCRSHPIEIPVLIISNERKRREHLVDETRDIYSLVLFDFESSRPDAIATRIVREVIAADIRRGAKIQVTGYASFEALAKDPRDDSRALKLSEDRATGVAALIHNLVKPGVIQSLESGGAGDSAPLYNNDTPEGRFYNRTMQVRIVTPTGVEE